MNRLADYNLEQIKEIVTAQFGQPSYRAKQLYAHITRFNSYDEMSDLPQSFRNALKEEYDAHALEIEKKFVSNDGTIK